MFIDPGEKASVVISFSLCFCSPHRYIDLIFIAKSHLRRNSSPPSRSASSITTGFVKCINKAMGGGTNRKLQMSTD